MSIKTKFFVGSLVAAFALVAGSASAAYMHTVTLKQGSSGAQVTSLQTTLNMTSCKVGAGLATGYFGSMTKAAVSCFQAQNGLTADGVVGPMTGAKLAAVTSSTGGSTGSTGGSTGGSSVTLAGTDGTISDVSKISSYNDEEVGEGENDVKVAGFEIETSNDGDVLLKSMKLRFDPTSNTGSDHLDDYIDGVKIWMGDKEIGSADADDFTQNSDDTYSKVVSLSSAVVKSDDTEKFYITVDAVSNLDSGDISGDDWSVGIENIRFEDGSGVVTTDDSSFTTGAGEIGWDSTDDGIEMNFVDFGTAADTELKFSVASDSPEEGVVLVDESDTTDDVVLLKGKIKLDGDSDVVLDEMPITFSPVGDNINNIASSLKLVIDGEEYTESVPSIADGASGTVTFDDLDLDISAGDSVTFEVVADINGTDDYAEGDSLTASFTSTNRDYVDAENEEGDQLSDSSEKSGTVTGEAQEFRSAGVSLTLVSTDTDVTSGQSSNDDLGTFKIKFKVSAVGDDVYVTSLATGLLAGETNSNEFLVDRSGTSTQGGVSVTLSNETDDDLTSVGNYLIEEGTSETFEATITVQLPSAGSAGQYRAKLDAIKWSTTDSTGSFTSYTSNLDSFKTSYLGLN